MQQRSPFYLLVGLFCLLGLTLSGYSSLAEVTFPWNHKTAPGIYQQRTVHHPDGIGKFYMGREIAQVMGHQGSAWLERSSRSIEEQPMTAINALDLKPTDVVADIGAGTGYFSTRISRQVPEGKVLAVDIQPEMLDIITMIQQDNQIKNIEPVLGSVTDPHLTANSVDLALMVDAYHEFEYPREMMQAIVHALKPDGRVALLEYRGENPLIPIKGLHKMTQRQVRKEMQAVGLVWEDTKSVLPQQHLMLFRHATSTLSYP
jgi:precorrin-6B methylase 2